MQGYMQNPKNLTDDQLFAWSKNFKSQPPTLDYMAEWSWANEVLAEVVRREDAHATWPTEDEMHEHFVATTMPRVKYDYRVRDIHDNGEFLTFATLDLLIDGKVVDTREFVGSTEFEDSYREGSATAQAISFGRAWVDAHIYTLEERLGPYGLEWEREQEEHHA